MTSGYSLSNPISAIVRHNMLIRSLKKPMHGLFQRPIIKWWGMAVGLVLATSHVTALAAGDWGLVGSVQTVSNLSESRVILLGDGRLLMSNLTAIWEPSTHTSRKLPLSKPCYYGSFTTTRLADGRILFAGGGEGMCESTKVSFWDPASEHMTEGPALSARHYDHTATLLADGSVLIAGGVASPSSTVYDKQARTELFNGSKFITLPPLRISRVGHSAIRLRDGRVLIVGGLESRADDAKAIQSVELWDPKRRVWRDTQPLPAARRGHSTLLLNDGQVMVVGGVDNVGLPLRTTEIWNPVSEQWRQGKPLPVSVGENSAAVLKNGDVLLIPRSAAGCSNTHQALPPVMLLSKKSGEWMPAGILTSHTAGATVLPLEDGSAYLVSGHLLSRWTPTSGKGQGAPVYTARAAVETRLTDGRLMLSGERERCEYSGVAPAYTGPGQAENPGQEPAERVEIVYPENYLSPHRSMTPPVGVVELFNPKTGAFTLTWPLNVPRAGHSALALTGGRALVAGGVTTLPDSVVPAKEIPSEIWNPKTGRWQLLRSELNTPLDQDVHIQQLTNGLVLFLYLPRFPYAGASLPRAVVWNSTTDAIDIKQPDFAPRNYPGAVLLADGRVLLVGAQGAKKNSAADALIWDSRTGVTTQLTPPTATAYWWHSLLLRNGQVLQIQSQTDFQAGDNPVSIVRLWDPASGRWATLNGLPGAHTLNSRLLEAADGSIYAQSSLGGYWLWTSSATWIKSAGQDEFNTSYTLSTSLAIAKAQYGTQARIAFMSDISKDWSELSYGYIPRDQPAMAVLADGRVMVAGGSNENRVQLWNPVNDTWEAAASLPYGYGKAKAVRLPSDNLLLVGYGPDRRLECVLWAPQKNAWSTCGNFADAPNRFAMGQLADGRAFVLLTQEKAEIFDDQVNQWRATKVIRGAEEPPPQTAPPNGQAAWKATMLTRLLDPKDKSWLDITAYSLALNDDNMHYSTVRLTNGQVLTNNLEVLQPQTGGRNYLYPLPGTQPEPSPRNLIALPDGCIFGWPPVYVFSPDGWNHTVVPEVAFSIERAGTIVLADGTVVIAGIPVGSGETGAGFTHLKASCNGIQGTINGRPVNKALGLGKAGSASSTPVATMTEPSYWSDMSQGLARHYRLIAVLVIIVLAFYLYFRFGVWRLDNILRRGRGR